MNNEDVMNILFSFILIGVLVLINSIQNTLWGLYWILFSLYMILFFMLGIENNEGKKTKGMLQNMFPIVIISVLITWLIQIFKSNQDRINTDTYYRNLDGKQNIIPDTFYNLYASALFILIIKVLVILKSTRDSILSKNNNEEDQANKKNKFTTTMMHLFVYGLSIITFLIIFSMYITITFYLTDG